MDLKLLPQCGPKRQAALINQGIHSLQDLLDYFPRRYEDRLELTAFDDWKINEFAVVEGSVVSSKFIPGLKSRTTIEIDTLDGCVLSLVFFGKVGRFVQSNFQVGDKVWASGPLQKYTTWQMAHPEIEKTHGNKYQGEYLPIYPMSDLLTQAGIQQKRLRKWVRDAYEHLEIKLKSGQMDLFSLPFLSEDYKSIHFPSQAQDAKIAFRNFKIREVIPLAEELIQAQPKESRKSRQLSFDSIEAEILNLPFELTHDQVQAIQQFSKLLNQPQRMNALLQADVGAGKTLVALLVVSMLLKYDDQIQIAIMAPTEVLAKQLFSHVVKHFGMKQSAFLSGSQSKAERGQYLLNIASGEAKIVVGTHSLFQETVNFKNLELVIIDEQHRFGVNQRELLMRKGDSPDVLMMSATPIPRSLVETFYGHLQQVVMRSKPKSRQPVQSRIVPHQKFKDMLSYLKKRISAGELVFWVMPKISSDEFMSVDSRSKYLEEDGFIVETLHGKMSEEQKELALDRFKMGEKQILVSTTVIEVGIDIPQANIICIEDAHYFGLSQLHQLRGRVGRSNKEAWCFLFSDNEEAQVRLDEFVHCHDGFEIAEIDLTYRGAGDLLGQDQSGWSKLRWTDFYKDFSLIQRVIQKIKR